MQLRLLMKHNVRILLGMTGITLLSYGNIFGADYYNNSLDQLYYSSLEEKKNIPDENLLTKKQLIEAWEMNKKQMKGFENKLADISQHILEQKIELNDVAHHIRGNSAKISMNSNNTIQNEKSIKSDDRQEESENVDSKISMNTNEKNEVVVVGHEEGNQEEEEEGKIKERILSQCCSSPTVNKNDNERIVNDSTIKTIEIVVAYCEADLDWMYDEVLNRIQNFSNELEIKITILSKCGKEDKLTKTNFIGDSRVANYTVMQLPNVGGCDYAYASYLDEYIEKYRANKLEETVESTLFLFIKDTPRTKENFHLPKHDTYRSIDEMVQLTISSGNFVCGVKPICSSEYSHCQYHDTKLLQKFKMTRYVRITQRKKKEIPQKQNKTSFNELKYKDLADFHIRGLNYTFPNEEIVKVCFGGTFAVPAKSIINLSEDSKTKHIFELLRNSLSRETTDGVAVEEHFAERSWAGILSLPASEVETKLLKQLWPQPLLKMYSQPGLLRNCTGGKHC